MSAKRGNKENSKLDNRVRPTVIITGPSAEELRPSEEEKIELQRLLNWEKRSAERDWIIGQPFIK